jgi:hypothetical protein
LFWQKLERKQIHLHFALRSLAKIHYYDSNFSLFFSSPCAALLRKISGYLQPGSRIAHELVELLREPEAISVRYRDYDWSRNDA